MIAQMLFTGRALWTPTQLTSAVWLDAGDAATITLNGSNVSQWNDKSGNNRNATQGTASLQPWFVNNASNGLPALQTDGGDTLVIGNRSGLFQNVGNATIAIVVKYVTGSNPTPYTNNTIPVFVSNGTFVQQSRFALNGATSGTLNNLGILARRNDADTPVTLASSTLRTTSVCIQIGNANYSSAQATHFTNGNQDLNNTTFLTTGVTSNTTPLNACLFTAPSPAIPLPGGCQIFEVLMFNSTLSTTDRQRLEGYLAWKWGTVASLPAGHPYKNSPPYLQ